MGKVGMIWRAGKEDAAVVEVVTETEGTGSSVVADMITMLWPVAHSGLEVKEVGERMCEGRKAREGSRPGKRKVDKRAAVSGELGVEDMEIDTVNGDHEECRRVFCDRQKAGLRRLGHKNIDL